MLARFRVLLPYSFSLRRGDTFQVNELDRDGYHIKVYAPYQAATSIAVLLSRTVPVSDVLHNLHPVDPYVLDEGITIDGEPTIPANSIQVDVFKPDFDRHIPTQGDQGANDPPVEMLFEVVNSLIHRLRSVSRAPTIHPLNQHDSCWRIEFLTDSGESLLPEDGKWRSRIGATFSFSMSGLTEQVWQTAMSLPENFRTKEWETLLLDAEALLPNIVPALVLAAAAIETFIESALNALAPTDRLPVELWTFINNRGDYRKEPSVSEQFDQLLHALSGHSLKERPELWEAFKNLRDARNALMHDGTLAIGGRPVTKDQAYGFIGRAKEIVNWIEALLPSAERRPGDLSSMQISITQPLIANRNPPTA